MPTVTKFDDAMIEAFIKKKNWRYLRDNEGDYRIDFSYDNDAKCQISYYLIRAGEQKDVLATRVYSDARIPRSELGAALFFCNQWNRETRWPKVFVHFKDGEQDGMIIGESHLDLEKGIHQELFDSLASIFLATGLQFWIRVSKDKPFTFQR